MFPISFYVPYRITNATWKVDMTRGQNRQIEPRKKQRRQTIDRLHRYHTLKTRALQLVFSPGNISINVPFLIVPS